MYNGSDGCVYWRILFCRISRAGIISGRRGYKDGRVIENGRLKPGIGGGLCNLANTLHLLVLHSPMTVTEFHNHSDALAPDHGKRIPFGTGTSVSYNNIDYRFRNDTDQDVQLLLWCQDLKLYGELRSEREYPWKYDLVEEDHHFQKEGETYFVSEAKPMSNKIVIRQQYVSIDFV